MRRRILYLSRWLGLLFSLCATSSVATADDTLNTERFGAIKVYRPAKSVSSVVLFFMDGEAESQKVTQIRRMLLEEQAIVFQISSTPYLAALRKDASSCYYLGGEIERLSQVVQSNAQLPDYREPIVIGIGDGAALAYTALAQSPGPFLGGISIDFCPELPLSKPLCPDNQPQSTLMSGERIGLGKAPDLDAPWAIVTTETTLRCRDFNPATYVDAVEGARLALYRDSPEDGEALSESVRDIFRNIAALATEESDSGQLADLPLVEIQSETPGGIYEDTFAIFLSGDGGWATFDDQVAHLLARQGLAVVGFDSLRYFWRKKSATELGSAITRIGSHFLRLWKKKKFILIGFSFGADVVPFAVDQLPPKLADKLDLVALLSPTFRTQFEIHLTDWLGTTDSAAGESVLPAIESFQTPVLCLFGKDDPDALCKSIPVGRATVRELPGTHHFDGDYQAVVDVIFESRANRLTPAK